jgi:hypothetical protein
MMVTMGSEAPVSLVEGLRNFMIPTLRTAKRLIDRVDDRGKKNQSEFMLLFI